MPMPSEVFVPVQDQAPAETEPVLEVVEFSLSADLPPPRYVFDKILPRKHTTLLGGHGGAGKSQLALTWLAFAACCRDWGGITLTQNPSRGLYLSLEDPKELVILRLRKIADEFGLDYAAIEQFVTVVDGSDGSALAFEVNDQGIRRIMHTSAWSKLRELSAGHDLVVVDNASDAYDADENNRRLVRKFVRDLSLIGRERDAAMLLLAHIDKNAARYGSAGNSYSGSTAWHNSARSRLALLDDDNKIVLHHEKSNLGPKVDPIPLVWSDHGVLTTDCSAGESERELADDQAVLSALQAAILDGQTVSTARTGPGNTHLLLKTYPDIPKPLVTDRQRFWNAITRLERAGSIRRDSYRNERRKQSSRWICG